jgi:hypothetical protein
MRSTDDRTRIKADEMVNSGKKEEEEASYTKTYIT